MKKLFINTFLLLILTTSLFAQNISLVENRIQRIEDFKKEIVENSNTSATNNQILELLYEELEKDSYTASSVDENFNIVLDEYNKERMCWEMDFSYTTNDGRFIYGQKLDVLYSSVLNKRYVSYDKMSESQLEDYQFNIDYYDNLFRTKTDVLYAEISFKILRGEYSGQYRFIPQEIRLYKNEPSNSLIVAYKDELIPSVFMIDDAVDYNPQLSAKKQETTKETVLKMNQDKKKSENTENDSYVREKVERKEKGRNTLYFSVDTLKGINDVVSFNYQDDFLNYLYADLTVGISKTKYIGLNFGYDLSSDNYNPQMFVGFEGGMNLNLGKVVRPYLDFGFGYFFTNDGIIKADLGCDIRAGYFLFTFGGSYNLKLDVSPLFDNDFTTTIFNTKAYNYFTFFIGMGLTW